MQGILSYSKENVKQHCRREDSWTTPESHKLVISTQSSFIECLVNLLSLWDKQLQCSQIVAELFIDSSMHSFCVIFTCSYLAVSTLTPPTIQGEMSAKVCPICCDQFKTPRVLPCCHTFCTGCLEKSLEEPEGTGGGKAPGPAVLCCPLCRTTHKVTN